MPGRHKPYSVQQTIRCVAKTIYLHRLTGFVPERAGKGLVCKWIAGAKGRQAQRCFGVVVHLHLVVLKGKGWFGQALGNGWLTKDRVPTG
ncbi:hypothetical protein GCM10023187_25540 [Nibrella viscosa]|uniref:Transposase n=1 Tax=Nibrella viscosa TaxID=1084524 RepID=A0ABP8KFU3_9BACT